MTENFKQIHIGKLIEQRMQECEITVKRAAAFLNLSEEDVEKTWDYLLFTGTEPIFVLPISLS